MKNVHLVGDYVNALSNFRKWQQYTPLKWLYSLKLLQFGRQLFIRKTLVQLQEIQFHLIYDLLFQVPTLACIT
jgi:hypothetical protein